MSDGGIVGIRRKHGDIVIWEHPKYAEYRSVGKQMLSHAYQTSFEHLLSFLTSVEIFPTLEALPSGANDDAAVDMWNSGPLEDIPRLDRCVVASESLELDGPVPYAYIFDTIEVSLHVFRDRVVAAPGFDAPPVASWLEGVLHPLMRPVFSVDGSTWSDALALLLVEPTLAAYPGLEDIQYTYWEQPLKKLIVEEKGNLERSMAALVRQFQPVRDEVLNARRRFTK